MKLFPKTKIWLFISILFVYAGTVFAQSPVWAKQMQGPYGVTVLSVVSDPAGNMYTSCTFAQNMTIGTQTIVGGGYTDICILKNDPTGSLLWYKVISGGYWHYGNSLCCDPSGNIYLAGQYSGNALFGSTVQASYGGFDSFVLKMDSQGNVVWSRHMGGTGNEAAVSVACDAIGNVFVFGTFENAAAFGTTTLTSAGSSDLFVTELDASNGSVLWATRMGGPYEDNAAAMNYNASGNLYITGSFSTSATFGSSNFTSLGNLDMYLAALSVVTGSVHWAQHMGGTGADMGQAVTSDPLGNVYMAGSFQGQMSYGFTTLTSYALNNSICYFKNSSLSGSPFFVKSLDGNGPDANAYAMHCSSQGKIYLTGSFQGSLATGASTLTSAGSSDAFLLEMDGTGSINWADRKGSVSSDAARALFTDANGNIYTGGYFSGTFVYGPSTLLYPSGTAAFIARWGTTPTALKEEEKAGQWSFFPNPFSQEVHIALDKGEAGPFILEIKDVLGKTVYIGKDVQADVTLNLEQLSKGVYEAVLSGPDARQRVKKIVKQ